MADIKRIIRGGTIYDIVDAVARENNAANLILTTSDAAAINHIEDGSPLKVKTLEVEIDPAQDLNGYDKPWPGGSGKNKAGSLELGSVSESKAAGTTYEQMQITSANRARVVNIIPVNATFTVSFDTTTYRVAVAYFDENAGYLGRDTGWRGWTAVNFTITPTVAKYVAIIVKRADEADMTDSDFANCKLQLELGNTATTFEPYSNICPITGHTGVNAVRTGKNLLPMPIQSGSYANTMTITVNDDKSFYVTKTSSSGWTQLTLVSGMTLKAGTYTVIEDDDSSQNSSISIRYAGTTTEVKNTRYNSRQVFTLDKDISVDIIYSRSATADNVLTKLMLFIGNTATATDYKPYSSASATYTLPQEAGTVYGGKLRVNEDGSGSLVVNRASVVVNGSETWEKPDNCFRTLSIHSDSDFPNAVSSVYPVATSYAGVNGQNNRIAIGTAWLRIHDERFSTVSDFTAYLSENNVQLVYELATPVTYTLTAQQVLSLIKGTNNVYADTGDTAIEYVADTKTYIDNKFAELQALILENV